MAPARPLLAIATCALALAIAGLGLPWLWIPWLPAFVVLAVLVAFDFVALHRAIPVVEATLPATLGVGEPAAADLVVRPRNSSWRPLTLRAEAVGALEARDDLELAKREDRIETRLPLGADRRGPGALEAIWIRATGPMGLLTRIKRIPVHASTKVVPALAAVRRMSLRPRLVAAGMGETPTRRHGDGLEFDELQVYAAGMDIRAIDWKASARRRELRVRRFRLEQNQRVVVAIDTGRTMADRIGTLTRLDHGIHAALSLADVALRNGDQVALQTFGSRPGAWVPPGAGTRHLHQLARSVAGVQPETTESNPVHAVRELRQRLRRRSFVVIVTEVCDPVRNELLAEAIDSLSRNHVVLVMALDDPEAAEPLAVEPDDVTTIARSVVLEDLARERRAALDGLRRRGVHVVQGAPGRATVNLLRRYLTSKRRLG